MSDQPLIYAFIEKKTNITETISFKYSEKHDLNVVSTNGEVIPFVQLARIKLAQTNLCELLTKTFEEREEEEEEDLVYLLELLTKTREQREEEEDKSLILIDAKADGGLGKKANANPSARGSLELYTKTEEKRESDDEEIDTFAYFQNLLELFTKTKEQRESEEDTVNFLRLESTLFDSL